MRASDPDATRSTVEVEHAGKTRDAETNAQRHCRASATHESATQAHEIERSREVGAATDIIEQPGGGGGGGRPRRLLLIALDGATSDLALNAWRGDLRTSICWSIVVPGARCAPAHQSASTPAWLSLFSGLDAGQLGVYGPRRRVNHSYTPPVAVDSRAIRDLRLWDVLGAVGKHVGVVGAPGHHARATGSRLPDRRCAAARRQPGHLPSHAGPAGHQLARRGAAVA